MVANINAEISICDTCIHVFEISTATTQARGKTYYQHRHPSLELHYVLNGDYKATCGGSSFDLTAGTMLLVPSGAYHDVISVDPKACRLCISFSMQKKLTKPMPFYTLFNRGIPVTADLTGSEASKILNRIKLLLEKHQQDMYSNDKVLTLCASLLLELPPYLSTAPADGKAPQTSPVQDDVSFKIDSFLGTNFMHNNAKSRIAADLYISPRQLQRIIRKNYGMNYREKLSETRLQIAVDLLCNSDMSIHKISEILGYSCSANFSAFIKRTTGKTPSQIRKEQ